MALVSEWGSAGPTGRITADSAHLEGGLGSEAWGGGGDGSPWKGAGAGFPCMTDAPSVQSHKPEQCHVLKAQHLPPQTQTLALTESQLPTKREFLLERPWKNCWPTRPHGLGDLHPTDTRKGQKGS